jgi:hypothetical protein
MEAAVFGALLWLQVVMAGELVGLQVSVAKDLPDGDRFGPDEQAVFGVGAHFALHHYLPLIADTVVLRSSLSRKTAEGVARVVWEDDDGTAYTVADHGANLSWTRASTGLEIALPAAGRARPTLGTSLGLGVVRVGQPVGSEEDDLPPWPFLVEEDWNGAGWPYAVEARTTQFLPDASAWLGLRFSISDSMAFGLEAGYTVCQVPSARHKSSPYLYQVDRSEFGLNVFRLGAVLQVELPG